MIVRPMQAAMDGRAFRSFMAAFLRFVVSNVWKTPTYNVILAGDPDALPADWEAGRQRYSRSTGASLATTWTAFALFLVALVSL